MFARRLCFIVKRLGSVQTVRYRNIVYSSFSSYYYKIKIQIVLKGVQLDLFVGLIRI